MAQIKMDGRPMSIREQSVSVAVMSWCDAQPLWVRVLIHEFGANTVQAVVGGSHIYENPNATMSRRKIVRRLCEASRRYLHAKNFPGIYG